MPAKKSFSIRFEPLPLVFLPHLFPWQPPSGTPFFRPIQIGLSIPRPELYERIDARIDAMLAEGFVAEVEALLSAGHSPDLPTFSGIGYQEIVDYLLGKTTLEEAVAATGSPNEQTALRWQRVFLWY